MVVSTHVKQKVDYSIVTLVLRADLIGCFPWGRDANGMRTTSPKTSSPKLKIGQLTQLIRHTMHTIYGFSL